MRSGPTSGDCSGWDWGGNRTSQSVSRFTLGGADPTPGLRFLRSWVESDSRFRFLVVSDVGVELDVGYPDGVRKESGDRVWFEGGRCPIPHKSGANVGSSGDFTFGDQMGDRTPFVQHAVRPLIVVDDMDELR